MDAGNAIKKVAVIGLGSIGRKHVAAFKTLIPHAEIVALRSSASAESMEGVRDIYSPEALVREQPDFVIIANPTHLHFNTLQWLSKCDIPLFIEKPLFACTGDQEAALVAEIVGRKTPTYVACNLRFLHAIAEMRERIKGERVNEVNAYCGAFLPEWRPGTDFRTHYSAHAAQGGGVHLDLIHEPDYVYWLFGKPVHAHAIFKSNSSLRIHAVDYANYLWEYQDFCASIVLNYYRTVPRRTLEVVCDAGVYTVDLLQNCITLNNQVVFASPQRIKDTYTAQLAFFIREVLTGKQSFHTIEEGYHILALCLKK